jgi:hypothetical protein
MRVFVYILIFFCIVQFLKWVMGSDPFGLGEVVPYYADRRTPLPYYYDRYAAALVAGAIGLILWLRHNNNRHGG